MPAPVSPASALAITALFAALLAGACQPNHREGHAFREGLAGGSAAGDLGDEDLPDPKAEPLEVPARLNHPPEVLGVTFAPLQWIPHCAAQTLCVAVHDPDGDPVEVVLSQGSGLPLLMLEAQPHSDEDGALVTACALLQHAGVGMVQVEVTAYDLVEVAPGGAWVRFETLFEALDLAVPSHDTEALPSYGVASAQCPCAPHAEVCDGADNDCNGLRDDGLAACACIPGTFRACYGGPEGTAGVGACRHGVELCTNQGGGFADCEGATLPVAELPGNQVDDDCDGSVDEG